MQEPRHSFAAFKFDEEFVYVLGGVSDLSKEGTEQVAQTIERFIFSKNVWEPLKIACVPRIYAFGFAADESSHSLYIVGGSDGVEMKAESWVVDFKQESCKNLNCDIQKIALNKVCLHSTYKEGKVSSRTLYSFGGYKSYGTSFRTKGNFENWRNI